jgi:hypothetical protein
LGITVLTAVGLCRYDDALATYRQGISNNARPVARLKRHFEDAKLRIQQKREKKDADSGQRPPRSILGEKSVPALGKANAGIRPPSLNDALDMSAPREKFSVFVQSDNTTSSSSSSTSSPATTQKLGSDVYRRKENVHEKSMFKGSILPQKTTAKPPPVKFAVFRDDVRAKAPLILLKSQKKKLYENILTSSSLVDGNGH